MTTTCIGMQLMSLEQWQSTPDHPIQRNTEEHASRSRHLKDSHPTQAYVTAVKFGDIVYKVDGHTRAFLWAAGKLEPPEILNVQLWHCTEYAELGKLYRTFDARLAADTNRDNAWGIMRKYEMEFTSEHLRDRKFLTAIRHASTTIWAEWRGNPMNEHKNLKLQYDIQSQFTLGDDSLDNCFQLWAPELELLDACNPLSRDFPVGIMIAALITLAADPESQSFWSAYSNNMGNKSGGEVDGVEALHHYLKEIRLQSKLNSMSAGNAYRDLAQRAVNCCLHYMKDETFKTNTRGGIAVYRSTNWTPLVRRLIKRKEKSANPHVAAQIAKMSKSKGLKNMPFRLEKEPFNGPGIRGGGFKK